MPRSVGLAVGLVGFAFAVVPSAFVGAEESPPTVGVGVVGGGVVAAPSPRKVDFFKEVRPILSQHCFQCHGPDAQARKADLRFDVKADALAEHAGAFAIKPGDTVGSDLLVRVRNADPDERMPPPDSGDALDEKQIAVLEKWIAEGAEWPEHWSFRAPVRPELPTVTDPGWVRDPIDAFVLARLEKDGLRPEAETSRESWLRRASFDLTGLPPTLAEIDGFVRDTTAGAYEKQVDRLLESTRYGERQASVWLDLARYADTGGYQRDESRTNWKWRDWVVDAYNSNMPFDRFTIEQLAGDLLPNATVEQRIATGFNRNHPTNSEAGEEEDEYRSAYVIDRVNTTSTVWMGLTLGCAQCHDHKYDPLSQRDYYAFYSFFNNVRERDSDGFGGRNPRPSIPVPNADQAPRLADLDKKIKDLETRLDATDPLSDADQSEWEARMRAHLGEPIEWKLLDPEGLISRNGALLKRLDDGSILSTGPTPVKDVYDVVLHPGKKRITGLRIEALPDPTQPNGSSGRASDGRFILSRLEIRNSTLSESSDPPLVYLSKAEADLEQKVDFEAIDTVFDDGGPGSISGSIAVEAEKDNGGGGGGGDFSGRGGGGWSLAGDARKEAHDAVLLPIEPIETNEASVLRVTMHFQSTQKFKSLIGRFRLTYTDDDRVRKILLPVLPKHWATVGPFPATDITAAYATAFAPESEVKTGIERSNKYEKPVVAAADAEGGKGKSDKSAKSDKPGSDATKDDGAKPPAAGAADESTKSEKSEKGEKPDTSEKGEKPESKAEPAAADGAASDDDATKSAPGEGAPPSEGGEKKSGGKKKFGGKGGGFKGPEGGAVAEGANPANPDGAPKDSKNDASPAVTSKDDAAAKPSTDEKPGVAAATEKKADDAGAKPEAGAAKPDGKESKDGKDGEKKKPEKLVWTDRSTWKDGDRQRLDGENAAWYLTRKIVCDQARPVVLRVDGPEGFKVWLNGEEVHATVPPAPQPAAPKPETKGDDAGDFAAMFSSRKAAPSTRIPLGLRAGENEVVVKAVYGASKSRGGDGGKGGGGMGMMGGFGGGGRGGGGGGSFTFSIDVGGEDALTHEVEAALRTEFAAAVDAGTPTVPATTIVADPQSASLELGQLGQSVPPAATAAGISGPNAGERSPLVPPALPIEAPAVAVGVETPAIAVAAEKGADSVIPTGPFDPATIAKLGVKKLTPVEARRKVIRDFYRRKVATVGHVLADELDRLKEERDGLKRQMPETLVMDERTEPRQTFVFKRGHYKNKGEPVATATPAVLPPLPADQPRNRLGLARWLVSAEHPLTGRVAVNRIWMQYFGNGIVRTADDFGIRSEQPSHPELLDYLAREFVDGGFDLKKLHRRIVLSATYRQSSTISAEKLEHDPENRLLSRGPRLRLTAEMIRDNALAISGLLVEKLGGKPVKPMQPAGLWSAITGGRDYERDTDDGQYRRGLYVYWRRGVPYPSFVTFDAAKRETCTVTRPYTTTPLQALVLLNDPVYVEAARLLGQRMLKEGGKDDAKRIAFGFRSATSRAPTAQELEILTTLLTKEREHYKTDAEAVKKLLAVGDTKPDPKLDTIELAAWSQLASTLLNLDATIRRG